MRRARSTRWKWLLLLVILAGFTAAWQLTGLREWARPDRLSSVLAYVRQSPIAPLLVVIGFVGGGLVVFPVTALVVGTIVTFGAWPGAAYSMIGVLASAMTGHEVGRRLGAREVERMTGGRAERVRRLVAEHSVWAVTMVRAVPIAPFSLINLAAGAAGVRRLQFALGTVLGTIPGVGALALLGRQIGQAVRHPDARSISIAVGLVVVVVACAWLLQRRLSERAH